MMRARNSRPASLLKKWIFGTNLAFILLLLLTYLTPLVPVEKWGWLSLLALTYPFVTLINILFVIAWLFFRSRLMWFSLVTMVLGLNYHLRYVKIFQGNKPTCEKTIQLMSYNMRGLSLIPAENKSADTKIKMLQDTLEKMGEQPDILCIQEGTKGDLIAKAFGLKHSLHAAKSSLWLLSRYPVLKHGDIQGAEKSPSCMWADIKTPHGILRVYNMHLVSNRVTNTTESLIEDMDLNDENTWQNVRFIINRYRKTTLLRTVEARDIRAHMDESPYPVVIAGDGNDPPMSHTYHVLAGNMKDSFKSSGFGASTTYASKLPLLRIDYLLSTPEITFSQHQTHRINYSDHYPVSAAICMTTQP